MPDLTYKRSVVAKEMINWLQAWGQAGQVFYGDEELIGKLPAISVAPGSAAKELVGAQYVSKNEFKLELTIYHGRAGSIGVTRLAADEFAEDVEDRLHQNVNLNGAVVHGYVSSVDPGYVTTGQIEYVGTRITWTGISKTILPFARQGG